MKKITACSVIEIITLSLILIIPNLGVWLCLTNLQDSLSFCSFRIPQIELIATTFTVVGVNYLIRNKWGFSQLKTKITKNHILILFCLFSTLSLLWSVDKVMTLYQLVILFFTTYIGMFLGTHYSPRSWLTILFYFFGIVTIGSTLLIIAFPHAAIMGEPHTGLWRGIFWHKNFTGSLLAFANIVFLLSLLTSTRKAIIKVGASLIFYLLSLIYVIFSLSAAGIVTALLLNFFVLIVFIWIRIRSRLKKKHYFLIGGISFALIAVVAFNYNLIFQLLNREVNLTGRVPLWNFLLNSVVAQHPIFGQGFSAIWRQESFRVLVTQNQGWGFQITNGHNGFIDILLNLGIVGVILIVTIFLTAIYRSLVFFFKNPKLETIFPFISIVYVILANLSISFLLEFESFHWLLLVTSLVMTTVLEHRTKELFLDEGSLSVRPSPD